MSTVWRCLVCEGGRGFLLAGAGWAYGSVSGGIRYPSWRRAVARGSGLLFTSESRRHCVLVKLDLTRVRDRIPLQRVDEFGRTSEVCPGVVPRAEASHVRSAGKNRSGNPPNRRPRM